MGIYVNQNCWEVPKGAVGVVAGGGGDGFVDEVAALVGGDHGVEEGRFDLVGA